MSGLIFCKTFNPYIKNAKLVANCSGRSLFSVFSKQNCNHKGLKQIFQGS